MALVVDEFERGLVQVDDDNGGAGADLPEGQ